MRKLLALALIVTALLAGAHGQGQQQAIMLSQKIAAGGGTSDLLTGLVSYWKAEETGNTDRADELSTNTLTSNGNMTSGTGIIGTAAQFGNGSVGVLSVNDNPSQDWSSTFTVSFWARLGGTGTNQGFMGKWTSNQHDWMVQTIGTGGNFRVFIANALNDGGGNVGDTTDANFTTATYFHFVVVFDGGLSGNSNRLKEYFNATQKTVSFIGTIPASLPNSTSPLEVGRSGAELGRALAAAGGDRMDEIAVWNVALTGAQITRLYNSGAGCQYPFSGCP